MPFHNFTNTYNGALLDVDFNDKRSYNSFVKNMEKASKVSISYKNEVTESETPTMLKGFEIVKTYDHVAMKPPNDTCEEIEIFPTFQYTWTPALKGHYWNDGLYHFFPKNKRINASLSIEDIVQNMVENGASNLA